MIICPNCNHQNPDGAVQCEACYTPLPQKATCSSCGATVQSDASFCGQCGADLHGAAAASVVGTSRDVGASSHLDIPDLLPPDPLVVPEPIAPQPMAASSATPMAEAFVAEVPRSEAPLPLSETSLDEELLTEGLLNEIPPSEILAMESEVPSGEMPMAPVPMLEMTVGEIPVGDISQGNGPPIPAVQTVGEPCGDPQTVAVTMAQTQLQRNTARLLHVQTDAVIELAPTLSLIRLGKPNDRVSPDIDISGFPDSEIVSRLHANIRVEGDIYYIEDVGSSNGTYVNNLPLPQGNRHRLRPGDRIALGKGDKVSFIFQIA